MEGTRDQQVFVKLVLVKRTENANCPWTTSEFTETKTRDPSRNNMGAIWGWCDQVIRVLPQVMQTPWGFLM